MQILNFKMMNYETMFIPKDFHEIIYKITTLFNFTLLIYAIYKIYVKDRILKIINKKNA